MADWVDVGTNSHTATAATTPSAATTQGRIRATAFGEYVTADRGSTSAGGSVSGFRPSKARLELRQCRAGEGSDSSPGTVSVFTDLSGHVGGMRPNLARWRSPTSTSVTVSPPKGYDR